MKTVLSISSILLSSAILLSCGLGRNKDTVIKTKDGEITVNNIQEAGEQIKEATEDAEKRRQERKAKGDTLAILKGVQDGREITVNVEYLPSTNFVQLTKEMQKQQKKNEDLGVLANVTSEIRKLLDSNHVICHVSANRDTKGLVEYNIMLGESL